MTIGTRLAKALARLSKGLAEMPVRYRHVIWDYRALIGAVAFLGAIAVIFAFALKKVDPTWAAIWLIAFTVGPPLWFIAESGAARGQQEIESLKETQRVAEKLWAAVVASLLYLFPGGPIEKLAALIEKSTK